MARFEYSIPDDFLKQLGKMEDIDRLAPKMIDEALPILEKNFKRELAKHKRTGDLINSVKKTKAGKSKYSGYYGLVLPTGTDQNGVRNMDKLAYMEFGTTAQPADPVITNVTNSSEAAVLSKMQEVFTREVGE